MARVDIPSSLTIRMYNVGFGDCFLLSFHYSGSDRHVLVDFGSTSAPKTGPRDYMEKIAQDIKKECGGKLHAVVATHRHRDHISGFAKEQKPGKIIASLEPDFVIQPWTEDPQAPRNALSATSSRYRQGRPDARHLTAQFLGSLEDMHRVAATVEGLAADKSLAGLQMREQLRFLGEDNLKNASAVANLMEMGKAGTACYVNAGMALNILPGVKCTVLGPPTLKQSNTIRKQRARDAGEFWQFRSFWAAQGSSVPGSLPRVRRTGGASRSSTATPPSVRWFLRQSRQIHADQMLELVRDLDSVMNNTSVILLFEVGKRKVLFPGDAQIENWAYALANPTWKKLLADVSLYKVGHHGSLNATPKSLWKLFKNKGDKSKKGRLESLCSTKAGKHGSVASGTEVPRRVLVADLEAHSKLSSTEQFGKDLSRKFNVQF
jgi:hypothetical protein